MIYLFYWMIISLVTLPVLIIADLLCNRDHLDDILKEIYLPIGYIVLSILIPLAWYVIYRDFKYIKKTKKENEMATIKVEVKIARKETINLYIDSENDLGLDEGEWENEVTTSERKTLIEDWVNDAIEVNYRTDY